LLGGYADEIFATRDGKADLTGKQRLSDAIGAIEQRNLVF